MQMTFVYVIEQIGPSVSISANARIGAGTRLKHCIILDDVEIKAGVQLVGLKLHKYFWSSNFLFFYFILQENALVGHAIVGWKSSIGRWACVEASLEILILN